MVVGKKKRILFAWEIGSGWGHIFKLYPVIETLLSSGHSVSLISCNQTIAEKLFSSLNIEIVQAPLWQTPESSLPFSQNFAQNLLRCGYGRQEEFKQNFASWLDLLNRIDPDLLIAEHAPTALLAARLMDLPRAAIGTGFTLPPVESPMPGLMPWFEQSKDKLIELETSFMETVNPVLKGFGSSPLRQVADIFEGAERFLCTLPELDHYGFRREERYYGPVLHTSVEELPEWPSGVGEKIFIYLSAGYPHLEKFLDEIRKSGLPSLACIRDLNRDRKECLEGKTLKITIGPIDLRKTADKCSFAVTHGGHGTASFMLLSGVPLMVLPMQLEQALWAYRLSELGLVETTNFFSPEPQFARILKYMLSSKKLRDKTEAFANKYASLNGNIGALSIANRCVEAIKGQPLAKQGGFQDNART